VGLSLPCPQVALLDHCVFEIIVKTIKTFVVIIVLVTFALFVFL
jgi:hypothetical protein